MDKGLRIRDIKKYFHSYTTEEEFLFFFGLLGPMPLLEIGGLTFFSYSIVAVILTAMIKRGISNINISVNTDVVVYSFITFLAFISIFKCLINNIPDIWKSEQVKNDIWYMLYFIVFIFYANAKHYKKVKSYLYGIYVSGLVQLIWSFLQFIIYYMCGKPLNDIIFDGVFYVTRESVSHMKGNSIILSGLCWNAANMAPLIAFTYCFSESIMIKLGIIIYSLISGSRTVMIGIAVCVTVDLYTNICKKKISRNKVQLIIIVSMTAMGIAVLAFITKSYVYEIVLTKIKTLFFSLSSSHMQNEGSASVHIRYWTTVFDVVQKGGLLDILFGYGIGCSGYPFAAYYNQWEGLIHGPWSTECDYINYLWGTGLISVLFRYCWYIKKCLLSYRINKRYFMYFMAFFVEGITYNISFNWNLILILFMIVLISKHEDICFERISN